MRKPRRPHSRTQLASYVPRLIEYRAEFSWKLRCTLKTTTGNYLSHWKVAWAATATAVDLDRGDIDRLAVSASEWEARLASRDFSPKRKAPDTALELIDDVKTSASIGARCSKRLPPASIMHEQVDDRPLLGDRALHIADRSCAGVQPS